MANKLPVGATIARTYDFAFRNFILNLGATWVPVVILLAVGFWLNATVMPLMPSPQFNAQDPQAMKAHFLSFGPLVPYFALYFVIMIICFASIFVGLTREALQLRTGSPFLQFPFGKGVWRLIGAILLLMLTAIGVYIGVLIASFIIGMIVAGLATIIGHIVVGLLAVLGVLAYFGALIYFALRAGFLLTPVVVAEQRISISRGWNLTAGNFWRIFAVWLSIIVPLLVLSLVLLFWMFNSSQMPSMPVGGSVEELNTWSQQMHVATQQFSARMTHLWFILMPIYIVIYTVIYGLQAGASAFSYEALTEGEGAQKA